MEVEATVRPTNVETTPPTTVAATTTPAMATRASTATTAMKANATTTSKSNVATSTTAIHATTPTTEWQLPKPRMGNAGGILMVRGDKIRKHNNDMLHNYHNESDSITNNNTSNSFATLLYVAQ